MTQDIYTFNRLVDGKKLFMLSSSDYSDFVSLEGDKVVSFSLHIFSYNQDRSFYQVQVDKEMIDDILVSGSDKITFVTQTYDKIGEQETPVIGDSYEQIPIDVPVPSVCDLNGYEIGYYLNTSSTEKTLVPIYRGTCTGNSKYEGEEYTVNGLIMFELF